MSIENQFQFLPEEIVKFRELSIAAVILFGSRALGLARENSDYDFGILLSGPGMALRERNRQKFFDSIYDILAKHIGGDLRGIDLVFLHEAPLELRQHVARFGRALYENAAGIFADFASLTNILYADFAPVRKYQEQMLLNRIGHGSN